MAKLAIILNKELPELNFSETFIKAHAERLPCATVMLIGIPGRRKIADGGPYVPSRAVAPLGLRWLSRQLGLSSVAVQDRKAMAEFLKRERFSAVLAEYGPTAVTVMGACRDAGIPLIAHFHGYDAYCTYFLEHFSERYQELFDNADAVIAVSTHMREHLIALGAEPSRTHYNSCGADVENMPPADPARQPPRFLMVGRLIDKKAPRASLEAFANVDVDGATLDVIGDGPLQEDCIEHARTLGVADRVTFHGALPHLDVLGYMRRARCFIQHSVCAPDGDHEGTPVSVLEAMGTGLPVVATRHGGIADVINRPELGTLVEEYDIVAMTEAMAHFARDAEYAACVGHNARREVMRSWTAQRRIHRLWEIIDTAIARHGGRDHPSAEHRRPSHQPQTNGE